MIEDNIFSKEFLDLNPNLIASEIKKNGFFSFNRALSEDFLNNVTDDVKKCGLSLNKNNVAGVYFRHGSQFFFNPYASSFKKFF